MRDFGCRWIKASKAQDASGAGTLKFCAGFQSDTESLGT